jgi:hypothetical protein
LALSARAAAPLAYWPFDGNLNDEAGSADGTFGGGAPTYVAGQSGQAIQFDGVDDYVAVMVDDLETYTITAWVKTDKVAASSVIARTSANGPGAEWSHQLRITAAGVFEHYLWDGGGKSALGTTAVKPGVWYFVAMQASNNGSMKLFVNGTEEASTKIGVLWTGGDRFHIGSNSGGSMGWFQGAVDEVRVYDSALTAEEVAGVMESTFKTSSSPTPAIGATDVARDAVLSWSAGILAETHDVYLGTAFDDVNEATRDNPMGTLVSEGQAETTCDPEGLFEFGRTYYWRVDEVNAAPDYAVFPGKVWSFTIEAFASALPGNLVTATASSQKNAAEGPANVVNGSGLNAAGSHSVAVADMWRTASGDASPWIQFAFSQPFKMHEMLVWNHNSEVEPDMGVGIREAKVEYSLNGTDWTSLGTVEFAQATGQAGYTANTTVAFDGAVAQYVKITPVTNWGGILPQYGLSEVRFLYVPVQARGPQPADGAAGVSVNPVLAWLEGREAVSHKLYWGTDPNALSLLGSMNETSYGLNALDLETTYYWRIDEVNEAEAPSVWAGHTWSFTTEKSLTVDDFESYTDDQDAGKAIFQTWVDGITDTAFGGSQVGHNAAPFAETSVVHGGLQAMPLFYDNSTTSFAEAAITLSQDWTASGVKSLSLYFYGDPANGGQLYLKINSKKVVYGGQAGDIKKAMWQPWNIDLSTAGVSLNKVTKLTIGIEGAGAKGVVYVDDIRLYARPVEVVTPVKPDDANLLAHFAFNGNMTDSSGKGANGEDHGGTTYGAGVDGQAIQFDGINDYMNAMVNVPEDGCTTAFWFKTGNPNCGMFAVVQKLLGAGGYDRQIYLDNGRVVAMIYNTETITAKANAADGEWHHVAHTYGTAIGGQELYLDGLLQARGTKATSDFGWQDAVHFGWTMVATAHYFEGMLDDARIYNKTLSAAEVAWLAGGKTVAKPF